MSNAGTIAAHEAEVKTQLFFAAEVDRLNEAEAAFDALRLNVMNRMAVHLAEKPTHDIRPFMLAMFVDRPERTPGADSFQGQYLAAQKLFGVGRLGSAFGEPKRDGRPGFPDKLHIIRPSLWHEYNADESEEVNNYSRPDTFSAVRYRTRLEGKDVVGEVYVPTLSISIDGRQTGEPIEDEYVIHHIRRPQVSADVNAFTEFADTSFGSGLLKVGIGRGLSFEAMDHRVAVLRAAENKLVTHASRLYR